MNEQNINTAIVYKDIGLTPSHVVNYYIERASEDGVLLQTTKLLKICFFGYAYYLAGTKQKIFPENIQAWQFGPVIPSVYYEYKNYNYININCISKIYDIDNRLSSYYAPFLNINNNSVENKVAKYLEVVWIKYKNSTANKLVELTHATGTPWQKSYKEGLTSVVISDSLIVDYYYNELIEALRELPDAE